MTLVEKIRQIRSEKGVVHFELESTIYNRRIVGRSELPPFPSLASGSTRAQQGVKSWVDS